MLTPDTSPDCSEGDPETQYPSEPEPWPTELSSRGFDEAVLSDLNSITMQREDHEDSLQRAQAIVLRHPKIPLDELKERYRSEAKADTKAKVKNFNSLSAQFFQDALLNPKWSDEIALLAALASRSESFLPFVKLWCAILPTLASGSEPKACKGRPLQTVLPLEPTSPKIPKNSVAKRKRPRSPENSVQTTNNTEDDAADGPRRSKRKRVAAQ